MTEFRIHLESRDGSQTRDITDLRSIDFRLEHTALSDWQAVIPYDPSLEDFIFGPMYLYADHPDGTSDLLFRGYTENVESDEREGRTSIGGRDITRDLTDAGVTVTYQNVKTHKAIEDFWNTYTGFDATVYQPDYEVVEGVQVQSLDTSSDFSGATSIPADVPATVTNGTLTTTQTGFTGLDDSAFWSLLYSNAAASGDFENTNGNVTGIGPSTSVGDSISLSFTLDHDVPAGNLEIYWRTATEGGEQQGDGTLTYPGFHVELDGTSLITYANDWGSYNHKWEWSSVTTNDSKAAAGSHTVEFIADQAGDSSKHDEYYVDLVAVVDNRYSYFFDNDNGNPYTWDVAGYDPAYLDGPELYPDAVTVNMGSVSSSYNVVGATLDTVWDDVSGQQSIGVSYDGGSNWVTAANTQTLDDDQRDAATTTIESRATLSRYGTTTGQTPLTGVQGQSVDVWDLFIDGSTESTIQDQTFEGNLMDILQDLHQYGGLRFHVEYDENAKKAYTYARGQDELKQDVDWTVNNRTRTVDVRDYANHVTVRGRLSSGSRPTATVKSDSEIQTHGKKHYDEINPSLTDSADVKSRARSLLAKKQRQDQLKATLDIVPKAISPGPDYLVEWPDGTSDYVSLETVTFTEQYGSAEGSLEFNPYIDFVGEILSDRRRLRNTQDAT